MNLMFVSMHCNIVQELITFLYIKNQGLVWQWTGQIHTFKKKKKKKKKFFNMYFILHYSFFIIIQIKNLLQNKIFSFFHTKKLKTFIVLEFISHQSLLN
jgi:hypothetical protein